ncbi:ATP-dependent DNA helicase PIF1-like protein, partial [Tanacetum coccineum]
LGRWVDMPEDDGVMVDDDGGRVGVETATALAVGAAGLYQSEEMLQHFQQRSRVRSSLLARPGSFSTFGRTGSSLSTLGGLLRLKLPLHSCSLKGTISAQKKETMVVLQEKAYPKNGEVLQLFTVIRWIQLMGHVLYRNYHIPVQLFFEKRISMFTPVIEECLLIVIVIITVSGMQKKKHYVSRVNRDQEGSSSKGVSKDQQQNACRSHGKLYCVNTATEEAIISFIRGLALHLAQKKIRVNGVALGPIWTPLQSSALNDADIARNYDSTLSSALSFALPFALPLKTRSLFQFEDFQFAVVMIPHLPFVFKHSSFLFKLGVTGTIVLMFCRMWDVYAATARYLSTDFVVCDSKPNKDEFRVLKNATFMLELDGSTTIRKVFVKPDGFIRFPFEMVDFEHLETTNNKYLIDAAGYVTNVGRTVQQGSKTLDFHLANSSAGYPVGVPWGVVDRKKNQPCWGVCDCSDVLDSEAIQQ